MSDPQPPQLPESAPKDVREFFECTSDTLVWKPGPITWLGDFKPDVTFAQGTKPGTINVNLNVGIEFTIPASVNDVGELVIDTGDLGMLTEVPGMPRRADIDAAVKRINDWFKFKRKKLAQPVLANNEVTLTKEPIDAAGDAIDGLAPPSLQSQPAPKPSDDASPGHQAPELPSPDLVTPTDKDELANLTERFDAAAAGRNLADATTYGSPDDVDDAYVDASLFVGGAKNEAGRRRRRLLVGAAFAAALAIVAVGIGAILLAPPPLKVSLATQTPPASTPPSPVQTQTSSSTATPLASVAETVTPAASLTPPASITPANSPALTLAPGATFGAQVTSTDKNALLQYFPSDVPAGQQVTVQRGDQLPPVLSVLANAKLPFYDIAPKGLVPQSPTEFAENTDIPPVSDEPTAFELSGLAVGPSATGSFEWLLNQTLQHPLPQAPVLTHYGQLTVFDTVYTLVDSAVIKSTTTAPQAKQFTIHVELDFTKGMPPQQWPAFGTVTPTTGQGFPTFSSPVVGAPTDGQQTLDLAGTCTKTGPLFAGVTLQVVNFGAGDAGLASIGLPPTTINVLVGFQENC